MVTLLIIKQLVCVGGNSRIPDIRGRLHELEYPHDSKSPKLPTHTTRYRTIGWTSGTPND